MHLQNHPEFQLFLEHTPAAVAMFDREMRYIATSRRWLTDYGFSLQSLIGLTHQEVFPDADKWKAVHQRCLAGAVESCEADSFVRVDGSVEWVKWESRPWYDHNGEIGGIIFSTQLITEQKHTEDALRASEALVHAQEDLEAKVQYRTTELYAVIEQLRAEIIQRKQAELALRQSEARYREAASTAQIQAQQLEQTLQELTRTQTQLVQSEKMSSLGQLVAGVAHEINNPVNFIYGNLAHINEYMQDLLSLVKLYQQAYPEPTPEIELEIDAIDLDFLISDLPKMMNSMKVGSERIRSIVQSLRTFSRLDEAEMKTVDIHEGIDSTLMILQHRLKPKHEYQGIEVIKQYGILPQVVCYPGQLNQVFMNLLVNAIDAMEEGMGHREWGIGNRKNDSSPLPIAHCPLPNSHFPQIRITTEILDPDRIAIRIADNGVGITPEVQRRLFDPFFTTKPIGVGTGLGLSISYQIVVDKHGGQLHCKSELGQGTEFVIEIPVSQPGDT